MNRDDEDVKGWFEWGRQEMYEADDLDGKKMWTTWLREPRPRLFFVVFEMFLFFLDFYVLWFFLGF